MAGISDSNEGVQEATHTSDDEITIIPQSENTHQDVGTSQSSNRGNKSHIRFSPSHEEIPGPRRRRTHEPSHRQPSVLYSPGTENVTFRGTRRYRSFPPDYQTEDEDTTNFSFARDLDFEIMTKPENEIEAHRMANNYLFGFRKWKSHVSHRSIEERSEVIQQLYREADETEIVTVCTVGNVVYVVLCGWWIALIYLIVALIMAATVVGLRYSTFCWQLSCYFIWPFGKFVYKNIPPTTEQSVKQPGGTDALSDRGQSEATALLITASGNYNYQSVDTDSRDNMPTESTKWKNPWNHQETLYWKRPVTYIWLLLGAPLLLVTHLVAFLLTWLPVVSIPVAKVHLTTIQKLLLLPPELLRIQKSSLNQDTASGDIIMYMYQALNAYYYKYAVDGMNVFFVNMMAFVLIAIVAGFADVDNKYFGEPAKFSLALLSIIPLAYYIGMGISSISAQSSYAVGAVLNATFGSTVEIILYLSALYKGRTQQSNCYQDLVKAGLVGSLLATTLLIPGMAMVVGGLKHTSQRFNPTSAGVTATLLFVSVAAVFAPSIFSQSYLLFKCDDCHAYNNSNTSEGIECKSCRSDTLGVPADNPFYKDHVLPLIYTCCILLPVAYIIGLIYSLKTHKVTVHDAFLSEVGSDGPGHGTAQWSRVKSTVILLVSVVLMSLCAEIATDNIQPLLGGGVSIYFVGVTLLALVPDIPEIIIGIQFALQNNISLSIEVGSCIAVQVCMLQIPVLVLANLIYDNGFYLLFSEIHIWSSVIGVLLNNYVFQDGKSNYFQGSALVLTYFALVAMYFFAPNPPGNKC